MTYSELVGFYITGFHDHEFRFLLLGLGVYTLFE